MGLVSGIFFFLLRNYLMVFVFRKFPLLFDLVFPLLSFIIMPVPIRPVSEFMVKQIFCSLFSEYVKK